MEPATDPAAATWARDDLRRAVQTALDSNGHLLTAGELVVVRRFLDLDPAPASLYARLHARRGLHFRLDGLRYAEVPDCQAAAETLVAAGFAWPVTAVCPTAELAAMCTVPELKAACRALGRKVGGRRADLLERLADDDARPHLARPGLRLRHAGLFLRLSRLFLGRTDGDLSRLVLERMELTHPAQYTPTGGAGLFEDRATLRAWEQALAVDAALHALDDSQRGAALLGLLPDDLALVERSPAPPAWQRRFRARRLAARRAAAAASLLERSGEHAVAAAVYQRLLQAGVSRPGPLAHRLALCLEALGDPGAGAALCQDQVDAVGPAERLSLERTGRRLARKAGAGWAPLPPLRKPRTRRLVLARADLPGRRPGWATPDGAAPLEAAVVAWLATLGRRALHGENDLWRTLFGLVLAELIFMPVPGMLPTPYRRGPLDLGTADFARQRQPALDRVLAEVAAGGGPALLRRTWTERHGQAIAGVRWDLWELPLLEEICVSLGGAVLAELLAVLARDWRLGARGLPDLLVLPGPAVRLPGAHPSQLGEGLLLAELKGPTDSLRDGQRVWLHRLDELGLAVELWQVEAG